MSAVESTPLASGAFVLCRENLPQNIAPGIHRQLLGFGEQIMGARVWFETNAVGDVHTHPHAQMSYVESGRFLVTIGDETQVLERGDSFYAEPHIAHGAKCLERGILIDVFSPMRKDFLDAGESR